MEQDDYPRSQHALNAGHDLLDTGGSSVEYTAVPSADLVSGAPRDGDQPGTAHAMRSPKERCRRLPERIVDCPFSGFELLPQSTGQAEGEQSVGVAMARHLVAISCHLSHDSRMGAHVRP